MVNGRGVDAVRGKRGSAYRLGGKGLSDLLKGHGSLRVLFGTLLIDVWGSD